MARSAERDEQQQERGQVLVAGAEQRHDLHGRTQDEGQEPDGTARHAFGHDPPPPDDAQSKTDEANDEKHAVAHQEHHQDDGQGHTRGERHDRPQPRAHGASSLLLVLRICLQHLPPCPVSTAL